MELHWILRNLQDRPKLKTKTFSRPRKARGGRAMRYGQFFCELDEEEIGLSDQPVAHVSPIGNYWVCAYHRDRERLAKIRGTS